MQEGQYIYCIIGTGEARNFGAVGVGGRGDPVTTIAFGDLSAVVSSVPMNRYIVSKETMLAHEKVIETVMADHTVLPVRFCTVAPNAEEIRNLLRGRHQEFKKLLRELDGKVELGLKALWTDVNAILAEIAQRNLEIEAMKTRVAVGSGEGHRQEEGALGKAIRAALEREKAMETESLLQPLLRVSSAYRLNRTYGDEMIMNVAFLVDRAREREFDSRVEQLIRDHDNKMEFKYVGPAPPYSFVNIVIRE